MKLVDLSEHRKSQVICTVGCVSWKNGDLTYQEILEGKKQNLNRNDNLRWLTYYSLT